ncbi:uncharacterized protein LOC135394145 isoform X2 [Ornithodoros turicata]|uniref:uncharacterized protein LOC135394145 isoform X2 n=1 Tax=Ornithodoros turicata TaxID=34597 RepID=UPI0031391D00
MTLIRKIRAILYRLGHRHPHSIHLPFTERTLTVNTCKDLYNEWRGKPGYWEAPTKGLNVPLKFVYTTQDRKENGDSSKRPLIMFMTGAPGTYKDYSYSLPFFEQNGVDSLAFTWPDTAFSRKTNCWWHSKQEKTQLVFDFLKALKITELDTLVAHSSACYVALNLFTSHFKTRSLALLNPPPVKTPRCVLPKFVIFGCGRLFQHKDKRDLASFLLRTSLTMMLHPVKKDMDNVFQSVLAMMYGDSPEYRKDLDTLVQMRLPALVTISDDDKLFEIGKSLRTLKDMGRKPETFWYYDKNEGIIQEGVDDYMEVIRFQGGSHYTFSRHSDIVNEAILGILQKALEKQKKIF